MLGVEFIASETYTTTVIRQAYASASFDGLQLVQDVNCLTSGDAVLLYAWLYLSVTLIKASFN